MSPPDYPWARLRPRIAGFCFTWQENFSESCARREQSFLESSSEVNSCDNFLMQDRELYGRILGIEGPWYVERVELKLESGEVHIYLDHAPDVRWACPECSAPSPGYDHQPERCWRHLDTCQYQTILHASPPRTQCREHGVKVVALPWAETGARFTALFEALAIEWLKASSQKAVAELLELSWDEMHGIMERAVKRGLERRPREPMVHVGVDEKGFRKGHNYLTTTI